MEVVEVTGWMRHVVVCRLPVGESLMLLLTVLNQHEPYNALMCSPCPPTAGHQGAQEGQERGV